jgi:hypothetical protein
MIACQSPHFVEISGMKSMSNPPLPIELHTICQNLSSDDYRKNSLLFQEIFAPLPNLSLPPTSFQRQKAKQLNSCWLKVPSLAEKAEPVNVTALPEFSTTGLSPRERFNQLVLLSFRSLGFPKQ